MGLHSCTFFWCWFPSLSLPNLLKHKYSSNLFLIGLIHSGQIFNFSYEVGLDSLDVFWICLFGIEYIVVLISRIFQKSNIPNSLYNWLVFRIFQAIKEITEQLFFRRCCKRGGGGLIWVMKECRKGGFENNSHILKDH